MVLPRENEKDWKEVDEEAKEGLEFVLAETMEDVLRTALAEGESVWK